MKVLGITGGVGAGKSTILNYLENKYQARILMADEIGKHLQQPGEICYQQIKETFGKCIFDEDGVLNRSALASIVFQNPRELEKLNRIIHPAVKEYIRAAIRNERERKEHAMVVVEAALLLEDHYEEICEEIWYIYTDPEVRTRRLMTSRGYSKEKVIQIMENQLSDAQYRRQCDFVIDNSSDFVENTYEQIDKGLKEHGFL